MRWIIAAIISVFALGANASTDQISVNQIIDFSRLQQSVMDEAEVQGLDWIVGEEANYNVNIGGFIKGTNNQFVREEVFEGFWMEQNMDLGFAGKNKIEILFDKQSGQILQLLVNGEKQEIPDASNSEIEEMKEASITVPAGTFDCVYAKIRDTEKDEVSEAWLNPSEVPMGGMLKTAAQSQFGPVTSELTSYINK